VPGRCPPRPVRAGYPSAAERQPPETRSSRAPAPCRAAIARPAEAMATAASHRPVAAVNSRPAQPAAPMSGRRPGRAASPAGQPRPSPLAARVSPAPSGLRPPAIPMACQHASAARGLRAGQRARASAARTGAASSTASAAPVRSSAASAVMSTCASLRRRGNARGRRRGPPAVASRRVLLPHRHPSVPATRRTQPRDRSVPGRGRSPTGPFIALTPPSPALGVVHQQPGLPDSLPHPGLGPRPRGEADDRLHGQERQLRPPPRSCAPPGPGPPMSPSPKHCTPL
jgi:hypothetical protein